MWQAIASYVLGWVWRERPWRELRGKQVITVEAEMEQFDAEGNLVGPRKVSTTKVEQVGGPSNGE